MLFTITNKTKLEELERIKALAESAGVELEFKIRGKIRWINLEMSLENEQGKTQTSLTMSDEFTFTIGWMEDENGKAIRFSNGESEVNFRVFTGDEALLFNDVEIPDIPETPNIFDAANTDPTLFPKTIEPVPPTQSNKVPPLERGQTKVIVHIDRQTSATEVSELELMAEKYGLVLEVDFKTGGKKMRVNLRGPDSMMSVHTDVDKKSDPIEVTLGWVSDSEGYYVRFLEREELEETD